MGFIVCNGYVSAKLAEKVTGFTDADLELLWEALLNMFEFDHAAARGAMAYRKLIVFKHESDLGNAPAFELFDSIRLKEGWRDCSKEVR